MTTTSEKGAAMPIETASTTGRPWLRDVVLFMTGQSLSIFGSAIVGYSVIWYVTLQTGSSGQYALLLVAAQLTMAITIIPGGVWADRYWRKALMIGADAAVAIVTAILAIFMLSGFQPLWLIALALALRGLAGGVQHPAVGAALPQIAPSDKLLRINSANQALMALIQVAAPALAAVLLTYLSLGWILVLDVITAAIGIGVTLLVRIPKLPLDPGAPRPEGVRGYFSHVGDAMGHAFSFPGLRRAFIIGVVMTTIVVPFSQMTPVYVVRLYGPEQWMLAVVEITFSVGMVVGGVAIAAWGGLRNRMTMIVIACLIYAAGTAVMGFMPSVWGFVAMMVVMGAALPLMNTPITTAIQETIPTLMLGRVMSVVTLMSAVCGPLGMAIAGPLADRLDLSWMSLACGAFGVVFLAGLMFMGGPGSRLYAPTRDTPGAETDDAATTGASGTTVERELYGEAPLAPVMPDAR